MRDKNKKPNNPLAFPQLEIDYTESAIQNKTVYHDHHEGMTLRDYIAVKAMQGIITGLIKPTGYENTDIKGIAKESFKIEYEILKQRGL